MRFFKVRKRFWVLFLLLALLFSLFHYNNCTIVTKTDAGSLEAVIEFFFPLKLTQTSTSLELEYPDHNPHWFVEQTAVNKITLRIQEEIPYGQTLKLKLGYHPLGLPIILHTNKIIVNDVIPKLIEPENKVVSSDKPVIFQFNTFIDPKSINNGTTSSIPGYFKPTDWNNTNIKNYSKWQFTPDEPLIENQYFKVTFKPSIYSAKSKYLEKQVICNITTAIKPKYVNGSIMDNSKNISLYPKLEFLYDQKLSSAEIVLKEANTNHNIPGKVKVVDSTVSFIPNNVLLPGTQYLLTIKVQSREKETSNQLKLNFTTEEIVGKYWLDIKLGDIHTVTVYQGQYPVRFMLASGGRSGHETPLGKYYTQDRGSSFWAARFGEGATYWVRIFGSILIHSVPKDANWQTKEEEHAKLGLPASHGCIRLSELDAKWVYENLPANTMLIIHN